MGVPQLDRIVPRALAAGVGPMLPVLRHAATAAVA